MSCFAVNFLPLSFSCLFSFNYSCLLACVFHFVNPSVLFCHVLSSFPVLIPWVSPVPCVPSASLVCTFYIFDFFILRYSCLLCFFFFFLSIFLAFSGFIDSTSRRVWQETVQVREGEQVDPGRESNPGLLQSLGTWVACATDRAKRRPPPFDLAFWLDFTLFKFCFGWACY